MSKIGIDSPWICCQLGARENYAIPRALQKSGNLYSLVTDAWVSSKSSIHYLSHPAIKPLRERFHLDLSSADVKAFTFDLIRFELTHKSSNSKYWERTVSRNQWFQNKSLKKLEKIARQIPNSTELSFSPPTLFAYSYAALELFRFAKAQGWRTILGQINPGIIEEKIVESEYDRHPIFRNNWNPAPKNYWKNWQEECSLADIVMVNSSWSASALQQAEVPSHKLRIVPLAYEISSFSKFNRIYPLKFSRDRPLRVLFLGQIILRKGIMAILEAAQVLHDKPIEFWIVGHSDINFHQEDYSNIRWIGGVPRSEVSRYYQQADLFLFPTLSDGFGLTQLEAQTWKLPLIVSKFCGEVVQDGTNGLVLSEINKTTLVEAILSCFNNPNYLIYLSNNSVEPSDFNLFSLQSSLQKI